MISAFVWSQIMIGIASCFHGLSFQFAKREYTIICLAIATAFISIHFLFLDAFVAAAVTCIGSLRFLVSIVTTDTRLKYFFILLIGAVGIMTYQAVFDILIICTGLLATWAVFMADQKGMRQLLAMATLCSLLFNMIIFSPLAIVMETVLLTSNLVGYWRFYIRGQVAKDGA